MIILEVKLKLSLKKERKMSFEPKGWNEPSEPCEPRFFRDSEDSSIPLNCLECDQKDCDYWSMYNEEGE